MKRRSPIKWTIDFCGALALWLLTGTAHAWVTVEPPVAPPAGTVTVGGSHFGPDSPVEVFLKWKRCSVRADAKGHFSCTFKVPKSLEPGARNIWTVNRANGRWIRTPFTVQSVSARTDWNNEAFDAGRTRYNPHEIIIGPTNVSRLQRLWEIPGTLQIVADGLVFIRPAAFSCISALNETDGSERWRVTAEQLGGDPLGILASVGGRLYVGTQDAEGGGVGVDALRTDNGIRLWRTTWWTSDMYPRVSLSLATSPDVPDALYFSSYGVEVGGSHLSFMGARSAADGHDIWHEDSGTWRVPLLMNGLAYFDGRSSEFYGDYFRNAVFRTSDGMIVQDSGYFLCHYDFGYCIDLNDASESPTSPPPPFVAAGFGLVVRARGSDRWLRTATLSVSKERDLTPLWSWSAPAEAAIGAPALTPSTLYVSVAASDELRLYAFGAADGAALWSRTIAGTSTIQPTVANGVVYLGNRAYDARNGDLLWTNPKLVDTVSPIVVNGRLYANQTDGNVSAWGLD
ncbi:outer membrane protein assembly factor BamB family protein [Methylolobus aquaticus]